MTTRHKFYRINGVDRAGTPWIECTLMSPLAVVDRLAYLRSLTGRNKSHDRMYWVDDPDDDERGDIESEVDELVFDLEEERKYREEWEVIDGSRGDGGSGSEGISGYGLSNPVRLTDREREPSFSLRSIPRRVFVWRWKTRIRRFPWGTLGGITAMLFSAAVMTWLALSFAEWALR